VYTELGYDLIREFFREYLDKSAPIIAIGGRLIGQARISNGQILPLIEADIDAMWNWQRSYLIEAAIGTSPTDPGSPTEPHASDAVKKKYQADRDAYDNYVKQSSAIDNFLKRIVYEMRNPGITAQQRAINFSATNVLGSIARNVSLFKEGYIFDQIEVARSPACRPDSDCFDVKIYFFPPDLTKPRRVVQTTVDVSDVVPVTLAEEVEWFAR
jgi:PatG C-terminal